MLRGDRGTTLSGIKADHNGADGVQVTGAVTRRPITGIATTGNHSYGVSVVGQNRVDIGGLTLSGDQAGGLELSRDSDSQVHDITAADEPNGVFLHLNSTNVVLDALTVTGGRTGILAEKTTTGLHVTGSTINDAHVAGMEIGGHATLLDGLTVKGSRAAIRVERGAAGVTADMDRIRPLYCRMCGECDGTCRQGLPVADVLRFLTYAEGYGQFALGRERYLQLDPAHASAKCADCSGCTVVCPHGVHVAQRMTRAQELFAC